VRGLILGRFQPFHLGHLELVKQVLSECDEIIIAITGSQFNYIEKDPFTAGERVEMIHKSLLDAGIKIERCFVVPIQNQETNSLWPAYLKSVLPKFDKIYSGNEYVEMLLADSGYDVIKPKFVNRKNYNATRIRKMIKTNDKRWQKLAPKSVVEIINKIDGVKRLRIISS